MSTAIQHPQTEQIIEQLRSEQLREVIAGLAAARRVAQPISWMTAEALLGALRVLEPELVGFADLQAEAKAVLDILVRQEATLAALKATSPLGAPAYLLGLLQGRYDPSGFPYLGTSIELAAALELKNIAEALPADAAGDREGLRGLAALLRQIEGARADLGPLLEAVGPEHLELLEELIFALRPSSADGVLHALSFAQGNAGVAALVERCLAALDEDHPLREEFAGYLARVRGEE